VLVPDEDCEALRDLVRQREAAEADSRKDEVIVAKRHDGPNCTFYVDFIPALTRFSDL
jgi:replicative DNA helicase